MHCACRSLVYRHIPKGQSGTIEMSVFAAVRSFAPDLRSAWGLRSPPQGLAGNKIRVRSSSLINCTYRMSKVEFSESLLHALKDKVVIVTGKYSMPPKLRADDLAAQAALARLLWSISIPRALRSFSEI